MAKEMKRMKQQEEIENRKMELETWKEVYQGLLREAESWRRRAIYYEQELIKVEKKLRDIQETLRTGLEDQLQG